MVRILLVDDEPTHVELIRRAFERHPTNFELCVAGTIHEARSLLSTSFPSLIITDWRLPDGEGTELIIAPANPDEIPVIVMTGHGNERVAVDSIKSGALDYIVKSDSSLVDMPHTAERALREHNNILRRKQAELELQHRVTELEVVNRVSIALRSAESLSEMILLLVDETIKALDTSLAVFWLYNPSTGKLEQALERGAVQCPEANAMIDNGEIVERVFSSGEPFISKDFASEKEHSSCSLVPVGWGGICVPVKTSQEVIGVLLVAVELPREFKNSEFHLLTTLAEIAGNAIHRTRLFEMTERSLQRLATLRAIDQAISSNTDLTLTLNILLNHAKNLLNIDTIAILRLNPITNILEHKASQGFHGHYISPMNSKLGEGLAGMAALERRSLSLSSIQPRLTDSSVQEKALADTFKAQFYVPLISKGIVRGVLGVYHQTALDPDIEWESFLEAIAGQAAIAIENAELFEGLQRSNMELSAAYNATIEGWSKALDLRDRETEGHTKRVVELTRDLARAMGMEDKALIHITRGALLHDIGKMGVPDNILNKTGPLSDEEWGLMRKHTIFAYEMLSPITYLRPALDIPHYHHEKWDGSGYPEGLKGEQIPLSARIFAIVDVWDALRSNRPYRKAWSDEKALAYILEHKGTHFDPKVVDTFMSLPNKTASR